MSRNNSDYSSNKADEKGYVLFRKRRYLDAKTRFELVRPQSIADKIYIARCYQKLNNQDTAEELFIKLTKEFPNNLRANLSYARFLEDARHQYVKAREILAKLYTQRKSYIKPNNYNNYRDVLLAYAYILQRTQ